MKIKLLITGLLFILFGIFGWAESSWAATTNLPDCARTTVASYVSSATAGDTLVCPDGTWDWSSGVSVTKPLTIKALNENGTYLRNNGGAYPTYTTLFSVGGTAGFYRISGFRVGSTETGGGSTWGMIQANGVGTVFRFDHIYVDQTLSHGRSFTATNGATGLIDHVRVTTGNSGGNIGGTLVRGKITTVPVADNWKIPTTWGDNTFVYFEDSYFEDSTGGSSDAFDCGDGGKYVVRYNTLVNWSIATHGPDSGDSCLAFEAYGNTMTQYSGTERVRPVWMFQFRGGTGKIYNNTIIGDWGSRGVQMTNYRSCENWFTRYGQTTSGSLYTTRGQCNGTWDNSQGGYSAYTYDGNKSPTETYRGYQCFEQAGQGGNRIPAPIYYWDNTLNGSPVTASVYDASPETGTCYTSAHIQANRDYYNRAPQTGDATYPYTAYTYPHPLTGGSPDTTPPSAPTGLTIN
ncbi:MAG: hypothetical protein NUV83_03050 [Candidatus Wolfebacteria bacterium]|nr:hypothetical protein [Candidatus Wolfebacteria bacterium]